jgi:chromosome segregation ATPase
MIKNIVTQMTQTVYSLQDDIKADIEDVKQANHEKLLDRNDTKLEKIEQITSLKEQLNNALAKAMQVGEDIEQYRKDIDNLEDNLLNLSKLNGKLAAIVLPVKEMYKEIIDEIVKTNGGSLVEVCA